MNREGAERIRLIAVRINEINAELWRLSEEMRAVVRERDEILDAAAASEWAGAS